MSKQASVLLIYTGGTIGMKVDSKTGALVPFNFEHIKKQVPELEKLSIDLSSFSFSPPIDSSDMNPEAWIKIASVIEDNYEKYDGFVVLHGSDTMAFTASALSFMFENLSKPIILTGSQLPIGTMRTDGKENLITSIEIAAAKENGQSIVPEVSIFFEDQLFRGNRTHKFNSENFNAFQSPNFPVLAEAGVTIKYNREKIHKSRLKKLLVEKELNTQIAILTLFPGISKQTVEAIRSIKGLKGLILETYGSGNAPGVQWFIDLLKSAIGDGIIILNVSQCNSGSVKQGIYQTSKELEKIGVVSGHDITREAAVTKLMYLLGKNISQQKRIKLLSESLKGEISI